MDTLVAEDLARTLRVAHVLGLINLLGHVSVRIGDRILVTPGRGLGTPPPNRITASDVLTVDFNGRVLEGSYPAPRDLAMHLAVYRARPDVKAVMHRHQTEMLAFGLVERELLPVVHLNADQVQSPLPRFGRGELVTTATQGEALSRTLGDAGACQLPGHGILVVGPGLVEVLTRAHHLEELAKINRLAASLGKLNVVSAAEAARIASQRAGMEDFRDYYSSLDPGPKPAPAPMAPLNSIKGVKERVALACHILHRFGLVNHLEHVSHRLPGQDRFVISPRGDMGKIRPEDLATVDLSGNWVEGPLPPPPFRFLHRDIFAARRDVQAIVHTHETYGRIYAAAGLSIPPVHRIGANLVEHALPVYDVPDLIFDEEPRRAVVALLGQGNIVHERAHGTDFVATNIEDALAAAIHRERLAELHHRALQLGRPCSLPAYVLERLPEELPSAGEWWYYWTGL